MQDQESEVHNYRLQIYKLTDYYIVYTKVSLDRKEHMNEKPQERTGLILLESKKIHFLTFVIRASLVIEKTENVSIPRFSEIILFLGLVTCRIFPDQGSNLCPLHWQCGGKHWTPRESPEIGLLVWLYFLCSSFFQHGSTTLINMDSVLFFATFIHFPQHP